MECRSCGNKHRFQALITDYRPAEIWEFEGSELKRFHQPDSGDLEVKVTCLVCDSKDVDNQGMKLESFADKSVAALNDDEWEKKMVAAE
jgi:hypothetical protein